MAFRNKQMAPHPNVIDGLRHLFATGTTFSGLLRYLLSQHTENKLTQSGVRDYLMQAFGIDFHQRIRMDVDNINNEHAYALVDTYLIPEIAEASSSWYSEAFRDHGSTRWLDNQHVQAHGRSALINPATPIGGISEPSWATLSPSEQSRLHQLETSNRTYQGQVLLMAQLCERLQRKMQEIDDMESKLQSDSKPTREEPT